MCTLTIHRTDDLLVATMNRDEALVRAPELRPQVHRTADGLWWVAPRDGEKGGTWMGMNSAGVIACLLNAYQPGESLVPDTSGRFRSRGEIVPRLLEASDNDGVRDMLATWLDPEPYPSFTLLVATLGETFVYEWLRTGSPHTQTLAGDWIVRSSSGWDSEEVARWREKRFAQWLADGEAYVGTLPTFHLLQEDGELERSPLMRREWSATRSITQAAANLRDGRVDLRYWPDPTPQTREPEAHCSLDLVISAHRLDAKAPQRA